MMWTIRRMRAVWRCALAVAAFGLSAGAADAAGFRLLNIDGVDVKWGAPELGAGATVSYGFATRAQSFPDAINCRALAPMTPLADVWHGDPARLEAVAEQAFGMWSRAAAVRFRRADPGEIPDILIGTQVEPRGVAFTNVWHGDGRAGIAPLTRATVCFNPEVAWTSEHGPAPADFYDFATVLAHEVGHAIGLDHPGPRGALMGYMNQGSLDALMPGDVAGAALLYGNPQD
jgi:hypothetical protein